MTDVAAVPTPSPEPGPDDELARREAQLRALSQQPAPRRPAGAASALADRFLLHTSWGTGRKLIDALPNEVGGLVLSGAKAADGIKALREDDFSLPLLLDREGYSQRAATEDEPFVLEPDDGRIAMFPLTIDDELQRQRRCGATVALTPTGYLHAGDSDALRAAVRAAARIDRDDVIFSVPLDVAWFTQEHVAHLVAVLSRLDIPKAIFIGGQFDPMRRYKHAVANLRRVVAEAGDVAVLRTDLTGFDAMSHGAFATSIGTGGSLRHMVPYNQHRRAGKQDPSPSMLFGVAEPRALVAPFPLLLRAAAWVSFLSRRRSCSPGRG